MRNEVTYNSQDEYEDDNSSYKKILISVGVGAVIIASAVVLGIISGKNKAMSTETVVGKYMEEYNNGEGGYLSISEMEELTRTISTQIDNSLQNMNVKELTDENMEQLLSQIRLELSNMHYSIPDDEMDRLASDVLTRVVKMKAGSDKELAEEYEAKIAALAKRVTALEERDYLDEADVESIIDSNTLTRNEIINMLQNEYSTETLMTKLSQTYATSEESLYRMISENKSYTNSVYNKLADKLGVSAKDIEALYNKAASLQEFINNLSKESDKSYTEITKIISQNTELTNEDIKKLAALLGVKETELKTLINNTNEITKKEYTSMIQDLQGNMEQIDKDKASVSNLLKIQSDLEAAMKLEGTERQNALEEAKKQLDALENSSAANLDSVKNALNGAIEAAQKNASDDLKNEISKVNSSISSNVEAINDNLAKSIAGLKAALEEQGNIQNKNLADARQELIDRLTDEVTNLQGDINQINDDKASVSSLEDVKAKLEAAMKLEGEERQHALEEAQRQLENLSTTTEENLDEAKQLLNQAIEDAKTGAATDLNNEITKVTDSINSNVTIINNRLTSSINGLQDALNEQKAAQNIINNNVSNNISDINDNLGLKAEILYDNSNNTLIIKNVQEVN